MQLRMALKDSGAFSYLLTLGTQGCKNVYEAIDDSLKIPHRSSRSKHEVCVHLGKGCCVGADSFLGVAASPLDLDKPG